MSIYVLFSMFNVLRNQKSCNMTKSAPLYWWYESVWREKES